MNKDEIDVFEKLVGQLQSLHSELGALAKKSPKDAVNTFKLKFVNSTLQKCNEIFGERYRPFEDFEAFSTDDMPSNSDVTFIISQYIECAEKFRSDNIFQRSGYWLWRIDGEKSDQATIRTAPPRKLENK
ncbi:hypothetical protein [Falsiroseomonas sp. CW058]|uniref:hypothetical protein n=1 Tax=Falsiroseomonas sp. CW058 TaxID=3388664 RepID=UPI003D321A5E